MRKIKCDGLRPSCSSCVRGLKDCIYANILRRRGPGAKKAPLKNIKFSQSHSSKTGTPKSPIISPIDFPASRVARQESACNQDASLTKAMGSNSHAVSEEKVKLKPRFSFMTRPSNAFMEIWSQVPLPLSEVRSTVHMDEESINKERIELLRDIGCDRRSRATPIKEESIPGNSLNNGLA